jgi:hypothetical protein
MHNYSLTNTPVRITAISFIAILSAYITFFLNPFIEILPIVLQPLSPFAVFGVLFLIFDKFLWKCFSLNKIMNISDFSGTWEGHCNSNSKKANSDCKVKLKIKQTFTQINVDATFNKSYSESFVANVDNTNPHRSKLIYSYLNKPNGKVPKTQDKHFGSVELCLIDDKNISGDYFTDRQPQTRGTLNLKKTK